MKLGLISDVHGNFVALKTAIQQMKSMKVDIIYHCGDLVGYYAEANQVIDLIRKEHIQGVMGNHDYLTLGGILLKEDKLQGEAKKEIQYIFNTEKNQDALKVIKYTIEHLTHQNKQYLMNLKDELCFQMAGVNFLIAHGVPSWLGNTLSDYLFEKQAYELRNQIDQQMIEHQVNVVVIGHTHIPYILTLKKWNRYVINTGSIGQPRDGVPFSSIVVMDIDTELICDIDILRSMYNIYETQEKAFQEVLPFDNLTRLNFGI